MLKPRGQKFGLGLDLLASASRHSGRETAGEVVQVNKNPDSSSTDAEPATKPGLAI